jgi:hypothetical protein
VECGSRRSAFRTARDRRAELGRVEPRRDFDISRFACARVRVDAVPLRGGGSFTPDRRAFDSPIAIACFVDRAPCLPSRT